MEGPTNATYLQIYTRHEFCPGRKTEAQQHVVVPKFAKFMSQIFAHAPANLDAYGNNEASSDVGCFAAVPGS